MTNHLFKRIIILIFSGTTGAQVHGVVKDIFDANIEDVTVKIEKTMFHAKTDKNGNYSIDYVTGNVTVKYSKPGYKHVN